jgi:hypothetical protein
MSDFTFACPSCNQQIQASSEHSGLEVDCPLCQNKIVIPAAPGAAEPPPAPKGKLSMAPSTVEHKPQGFAPPPPPKKKKKKIEPALLAEIIGGVALVVAGILYGPKLYHNYKQKQADKEAAAIAESQPPPPPPEPSAAEIMRQVGDKYKKMSSFAAEGKTTANLDMSELAPNNPSAKSISLTADTAIRLGRPDHFRLEWALQTGQATIKGSAWSAGKGIFVAEGPYPAKTRNREIALSEASGSSGTLGMILAEMFFDDKGNPTSAADQFAKTNGDSISGQDCYVLTGAENGAQLELWVNKKTFLVAQTEVFLKGTLDEAAYKAETNATVKAQELRTSKIRGAITETYNDIALDKEMAAADFEKPATAGAPMTPTAVAPMPGNQPRRPRQ